MEFYEKYSTTRSLLRNQSSSFAVNSLFQASSPASDTMRRGSIAQLVLRLRVSW